MKTSGYLSLAFIFAILIGAGGFSAIWTAIWFARGSFLTAVLCLGASLLLVSMLFHLAFPLTGAAHPRTEHGTGGTTVRPQRYADRIFSGGLLTGVASAVAFLVFSQFGLVDFIPSNVNGLIMPAACIFYVVYGVPTLYRILKLRDGKHLRLDPDGFEVWDSQWNSFARGAWERCRTDPRSPAQGQGIIHRADRLRPSQESQRKAGLWHDHRER